MKLRRALAAGILLLNASAGAAPQAKFEEEMVFEGWAEEIRPLFQSDSSLDDLADLVEHDVLGFRLEYATTYKEEELTVSGLVVFPLELDAPAPILVWNHGTLFDEHGAPSSWKEAERVELVSAMHGMITFLPDYAGYGVSADVIHPYVLREDLVASVLDMIPAGKAFLGTEGVPFSDDLYLWGFSEGGYVTLAVAHEIETSAEHGLTLAETHAVSGPFSLLETCRLILADETYPIPAYVAYFVAAYDDRYWNRPAGDFFEEPYASVVERFLKRQAGLVQLAGSMPATLGSLLKDDFQERLANGGERAFQSSLASNGVPTWAPRHPTFLYHGTRDRDVPYDVAVKQYEAMLAEGADPERLTFVTYEGADHGTTGRRAWREFLARRR